MDPVLVLQLAQLVYGTILRPLVVDSVKESETLIDDGVLQTCDNLFLAMNPNQLFPKSSSDSSS